jgi:hypothetical protein
MFHPCFPVRPSLRANGPGRVSSLVHREMGLGFKTKLTKRQKHDTRTARDQPDPESQLVSKLRLSRVVIRPRMNSKPLAPSLRVQALSRSSAQNPLISGAWCGLDRDKQFLDGEMRTLRIRGSVLSSS